MKTNVPKPATLKAQKVKKAKRGKFIEAVLTAPGEFTTVPEKRAIPDATMGQSIPEMMTSMFKAGKGRAAKFRPAPKPHPVPDSMRTVPGGRYLMSVAEGLRVNVSRLGRKGAVKSVQYVDLAPWPEDAPGDPTARLSCKVGPNDKVYALLAKAIKRGQALEFEFEIPAGSWAK